MTRVRLASIVLLATACGREPAIVAEPLPEEHGEVASSPEEREREAYLDDPRVRRRVLEASLGNPDNGYSRDRLAAYGLTDAGWELLPLWNPRVVPMTRAMLPALRSGQLQLPRATQPLWDGVVPNDEDGWRELGQRVFVSLPLRADDSLAHALRDETRASELGLFTTSDGSYPGLVVFDDLDGTARVGITCALCHSAPHDGRAFLGMARRALDYGRARLQYHAETAVPLDDALARRMARWGRGRADITGDDDEDPVAIPDLWRLPELTALTQGATLRLGGREFSDPAERHARDLVVLAIRQETQVIQANGERARPPRELAWAMAMFVASLEPPTGPFAEVAGMREGRAAFARHCRRCHDGPAGSGPPVAATLVGTDAALVNSAARGTGTYRPAPLVAVAAAAPYFHDGSVATLEDVLDPERMSPQFTRGVHGPGAVPGHAWGTQLPAEERAAIIAYVRSL